MKDLLIHVSSQLVEVLEPRTPEGGGRGCICFSLNNFCSWFGDYVYLFDKEVMHENFNVVKLRSGYLGQTMMSRINGHHIHYRYRSEDFGNEYRIYDPINVSKFCINVIQNFNHTKGVLERRLADKLIQDHIVFEKEDVDFSKLEKEKVDFSKE